MKTKTAARRIPAALFMVPPPGSVSSATTWASPLSPDRVACS